jgi:alpha-tubulin suppressor-like RCC1 family protein
MWMKRWDFGAPHGLASALVPALALVLLGCGEAAELPSAPQSVAQGSALVTGVSGALPFRQLSAAGEHTCGTTTADRAYCWGGGRRAPVPVSGGLRFLEVNAGVSTDCGITIDQRLFCWGRDLIPAEVPGGRRFRQVSVGDHHICAVNPFDVAFCWGENTFGQLGTGGTFTTTPTRVAGGLRWRRVFAAASHTCGTTTDDRAYCWGSNVFGQIGDGTYSYNRSKPTAVAGGLRFRQVKPGSGYDAGLNQPELDTAFSCGVTTDNRAYCWGNFALGSNVTNSNTPVAVAGGVHFEFVHLALWHACALNPFNVAFCWGSNEFAQLGIGSVGGFSMTPVRVVGGLRFRNLTASTTGFHNCGVTTDDRAYCWGRNSSGQLGDGTTVLNRPVPVAVVAPM